MAISQLLGFLGFISISIGIITAIWIVILAFQEGFLWGILVWFIPIVFYFFIIKNLNCPKIRKVGIAHVIAIILGISCMSSWAIDGAKKEIEETITTEVAVTVELAKLHVANQSFFEKNNFFAEDLFELHNNYPEFDEDLVYADNIDFLFNGYYFEYSRAEENKYQIYAIPEKDTNITFFLDQKGSLKAKGPDGDNVTNDFFKERIKNLKNGYLESDS